MPGKEKAPKKSKVEIELEKQLEIEEAARAEEADLKRQEDEERRRREAEAARRVAAAEKRKDELERLGAQRLEDQEAEAARLAALDNLAREEASVKEWSRFIECSTLPDCMKEPDLNAHITLWGLDEDALAEDERRLERQRVKDRKHRVGGSGPPAPADSERHAQSAEHDDTSERARLKRVLDGCASTERLVGNLQARIADAAEDRDLAQVEWCLQYVRRYRDLTALKIDTATARVLQCGDELERVLEDTAAAALQQAAQAKAPARGPAGANAPKAQAAAAHPHNNQPEELKKEVLECIRAGDIDYGLWAHTNQRFFRRKAVSFKEIGITVDLPKSAAMLKMPLALRVIRTLYDQVSALNPSSHYVSVGGVLQLQQLNLPPPAKSLKGGWLMRELTPLATSVSVAVYNSSGTAGNSAQLQPFRLSYRVPEFVYLPGGTPKIGWWNARTACWDEEGITDVKFSPDDRVLQLSTSNLEPLSIIQPRALDFPYRGWSYSPTGSESGVFRVSGSRFEARMEVRAGRVRLQRPSAPALVQATQLTSPGALLKALARSGINLMPTDEDAEFCRKPLKTKAVEARVHAALAQIAHAFEIRSSTLNGSRGTGKCVVELRLWDPAFDQSEPIEDPGSWVTVLCDEERFVCIDPSESQGAQPVPAGSDYGEAELAGELSHSSLRRALVAYYTNKKNKDAPKSAAPSRPKRGASEELEAVQTALRADDSQILRWHLAARRMFNLLRPFVFH